MDLFWRQNNYDPSITKMDHHIDKMSEKVINECINDGRLVGINAGDQQHPQKYARKNNYFEQKEDIVNCPICNQPNSRGACWMAADNIKVVSMPKHPGSRAASNKEQCYAK